MVEAVESDQIRARWWDIQAARGHSRPTIAVRQGATWWDVCVCAWFKISRKSSA